MRKKGSRITVYSVCIIITIFFFALFTARLADWQLVHGEEYRRLASRSTAYTVSTDAVGERFWIATERGLLSTAQNIKSS